MPVPIHNEIELKQIQGGHSDIYYPHQDSKLESWHSENGGSMRRVLVRLLLFLPLVAPTVLLADLVTNQWYEFSFTAAGVQAQGCFPADMSATALDCIPSSAGNTVFAKAP